MDWIQSLYRLGHMGNSFHHAISHVKFLSRGDWPPCQPLDLCKVEVNREQLLGTIIDQSVPQSGVGQVINTVRNTSVSEFICLLDDLTSHYDTQTEG